jgi:Holliday junction resolvase
MLRKIKKNPDLTDHLFFRVQTAQEKFIYVLLGRKKKLIFFFSSQKGDALFELKSTKESLVFKNQETQETILWGVGSLAGLFNQRLFCLFSSFG